MLGKKFLAKRTFQCKDLSGKGASCFRSKECRNLVGEGQAPE